MSYLSQSLALHQVRSATRPSPDLVRLAVTSATVLRVFSSPGQNASLRPVPFYCYLVCCDRLTACASRDLVAYLPDCLAGLFTRVSCVSPIWSSLMSTWLKSSITWPPSFFFPHHTYTHPSSVCYIVFTIRLNCFGCTIASLTHLVRSSSV